MSYSDIEVELALQMKERRKSLKRTQQEVADKSGLGRVKIAQLESGRYRMPTFDTLEKWAVGLDLEMTLVFEPIIEGEK